MQRMRISRILFFATVCCLASQNGIAQSDTPRLEIGPQFSILKLKYSFNSTEAVTKTADDYWVGFGGRITYNFSDNFAVEGSLEKFFTDEASQTMPFSRSAQPSVQGLFGIKAGVRLKRFGMFGKIRPGFTRYSRVFDCASIGFDSCREIQHTGFSLDFGYVVEGYISRRILYRGDAGAIYLRHRETTLFFPGEPGIPPFQFSSQGFKKVTPKFSIGLGFRF